MIEGWVKTPLPARYEVRCELIGHVTALADRNAAIERLALYRRTYPNLEYKLVEIRRRAVKRTKVTLQGNQPRWVNESGRTVASISGMEPEVLLHTLQGESTWYQATYRTQAAALEAANRWLEFKGYKLKKAKS
jgi:hypothetical protein